QWRTAPRPSKEPGSAQADGIKSIGASLRIRSRPAQGLVNVRIIMASLLDFDEDVGSGINEQRHRCVISGPTNCRNALTLGFDRVQPFSSDYLVFEINANCARFDNLFYCYLQLIRSICVPPFHIQRHREIHTVDNSL